MFVNFIIKGRLGNAIFRYMACSIMCIKYNYTYCINNNQQYNCSDEEFYDINNKSPPHLDYSSMKLKSINMTEYYQHDTIYKYYKKEIINFIKKNQDHVVFSDGINAGDNHCETFKMIDIITTPQSFSKIYKNVLHVRLEDFVKHNLYIPCERLIQLLENNIVIDSLCIVCKRPTTEFELNYLKTIKIFLEKKNITVHFEHNDTLTDYYIMKTAETLICSKSTLSWCAAFFSENIKTCYFPDYIEQPKIMTCKAPIDNTTLY